MNPDAGPFGHSPGRGNVRFDFRRPVPEASTLREAPLTLNQLATLSADAAHRTWHGEKPQTCLQLLYEDTQTGLVARQVCERIAARFNLDTAVQVRLARFELLSDPLLSEIVLKDAQDAAMLVLSARGSDPLPVSVYKWIERWLASNTLGPRAIVLLLGTDDWGYGGAEQILAQLENAAVPFDVDIFPLINPLPITVWQAPVHSKATFESMEIPQPIEPLNWAKDWENRFWGINE